jgi:hypothetical protein
MLTFYLDKFTHVCFFLVPLLNNMHLVSNFVLTTFQRFPGGETSGDPKVIDQVRHMFFRI